MQLSECFAWSYGYCSLVDVRSAIINALLLSALRTQSMATAGAT